MIKQITMQPYHGILLSNKKEWTVDTNNNLDGSQGHYTEWKGEQFQKVTYDFM